MDNATQAAAQDNGSSVKFNGLQASLSVRLTNCASWHMERADLAKHKGESEAADRHDRIALRLFKRAHVARATGAA